MNFYEIYRILGLDVPGLGCGGVNGRFLITFMDFTASFSAGFKGFSAGFNVSHDFNDFVIKFTDCDRLRVHQAD